MMIKIAVMSDNHGDQSQIQDFLTFERDANYYIHCGDSESFDSHVLDKFYAVKGNNDWFLDLKNDMVFCVEDHRILITHGARTGYFNREYILADMAKAKGCNIVLAGHTHIPMDETVDGVRVINPGSTRLPRNGSPNMYCVLEIDGPTVNVVFKSIFDGKEINFF